MKSLKIIRVVLAFVIFTLITAYFCDFGNRLPRAFHALMHIQVVPAVLAGSVGLLAVLFLLTFLFGRIYCSVVCPLGVFQDIVAWFTRRGKEKNKRKRWYHYSKPYNIVRYTLLIVCAVFLIFGNIIPLVYLDPYSNFGRIAVNIFRPIMVEGNNLLSFIALQLNHYGFYNVTIHTITTASFLIALAALLLVGILALLRGRFYCNTICPVGSLLGLISRFSIFRIMLNESKCTQCGLCEKACKAECIDSKERNVDLSRCVTCFNCLDRCNKGAIKYKAGLLRFARKDESLKELAVVYDEKRKSRRKFLITSTAIAATVPLIPAWAQENKPVDVTKLVPITPPGSRSLERFKQKCTACHLCITHCPMQVLKPAGFNFGLEYAFKPHLVFREKAYCNYNCTLCGRICPTGAIQSLELEKKRITQIGVAQFDKNRCIVYTDEYSCGACAEHCPVKAVRMEPYKDGLTIPTMYPELCMGCGGCESICPMRPKAINVMPNAVHGTAKHPHDEEIDIDAADLGFGF